MSQSPPENNKVKPKGTRVPITPERAKLLARVDRDTVLEVLSEMQKRNPALYSLLVAVQEEADLGD